MKKIVALLLAALMIMSLAACGGEKTPAESEQAGNLSGENKAAENAPADPIVLRVSCQQAEVHANTQAMMRIKEKVEKETNGGLILDLYPGAVLGDYTLTFEETMLGTIDVTFQSLDGKYDPRIELTFLPYLFTDTENRKMVCSPGSNTYSLFEEILADQGLKLLGIYGEGYVGVGTNILCPEYGDPTVMKDSLIRCNTADSNRLSVEGLGYPFVTMTFADTYTALQTGAADGTFGNTAESIYTNFRDVVKYFIRYKSIAENNEILINMDKWNSLPTEYQEILQNAVQEECMKSFDTAEDIDAKYCKMLEEAGIEVIDLTEEEMEAVTENVRKHAWPAMAESLTQEVIDVVCEDVGITLD